MRSNTFVKWPRLTSEETYQLILLSDFKISISANGALADYWWYVVIVHPKSVLQKVLPLQRKKNLSPAATGVSSLSHPTASSFISLIHNSLLKLGQA